MARCRRYPRRSSAPPCRCWRPVFGAPESYSAEEIARAQLIPRNRIIPLSAMPLSYTIVCLGENPPPPVGEMIPIFDDAQRSASVIQHEEDAYAIPSHDIPGDDAADVSVLAGAGTGTDARSGNRWTHDRATAHCAAEQQSRWEIASLPGGLEASVGAASRTALSQRRESL